MSIDNNITPSKVAFGGGVNSTAMLIGMVERGYPAPTSIMFADTGGEREQTYDHVARFSRWLVRNGYPAVHWTKKGGSKETLEEVCLRLGTLPSRAFGRSSCSLRFKVEPQNRDCNHIEEFKTHWRNGGLVDLYIGYGAEESRRLAKAQIEDDKFRYRFPLSEWGWDREACQEAIDRAGLPQPGKSACWFCPSMTKREIVDLRTHRPDLFARAIAMEDGAISSGKLKNVKGLGRHFSWRDVHSTDGDESGAGSCMFCLDE